MRPSQLNDGLEAQAEILGEALRHLGVRDEDAAVYWRRPGTEQYEFLIATPLGLVVAAHGLHAASRRWRLTTRLVEWRNVTVEVTTDTYRADRADGKLITECTVRIEEAEYSTDTDREAREDHGLIAFAAACLLWRSRSP